VAKRSWIWLFMSVEEVQPISGSTTRAVSGSYSSSHPGLGCPYGVHGLWRAVAISPSSHGRPFFGLVGGIHHALSPYRCTRLRYAAVHRDE
jgi:hypothetical protein